MTRSNGATSNGQAVGADPPASARAGGGGREPQPDTPPPTNTLKNRTAKRIAIQPKAKGTSQIPSLIIPPFGQRALLEAEIETYDYAPWTRQGLVTKESVAGGSNDNGRADLLARIAGYSLLGMLGCFTTGFFFEGWTDAGWIGMGITVVVLIVAVLAKSVGATVSRMFRMLNVFLVVLIGTVPPVVGTVLVDNASVADDRSFVGVSVIPMWILLATATILPASLYFWFHRQKMPVVRENFLRDIVRLDPNVQTIEDADTAYSGIIDDLYGPNPTRAGGSSSGSGSGSGKAWGGAPILIVTVLMAGLWNWTLLAGVEQRESAVINARATAAAAAGLDNYDAYDGPPPVPGYTEDPPDVLAVLTPHRDVVTFAFLGSYFFALGMLFRRYARSDLGPKTYTQVCVRIILALTITWAVSQADFLQSDGQPTWTMLLLAFFIGIIPETGTAVIQDLLRKAPLLGRAIPSLQEQHPLDRLGGISLYDRSQLLEVGIENVESLAHNNLVELLLWTRIPASRLVDFVDQAILYLHAQGPAQLGGADRDGARQLLASYGLRTATDLELEHRMARQRDHNVGVPHAEVGPDEQQLLSLLDAPNAPVHRLQVMLDAMADDEWMGYVRNWRNQSLLTEPLQSPDEFVRRAAAETDAKLAGSPATPQPAQT